MKQIKEYINEKFQITKDSVIEEFDYPILDNGWLKQTYKNLEDMVKKLTHYFGDTLRYDPYIDKHELQLTDTEFIKGRKKTYNFTVTPFCTFAFKHAIFYKWLHLTIGVTKDNQVIMQAVNDTIKKGNTYKDLHIAGVVNGSTRHGYEFGKDIFYNWLNKINIESDVIRDEIFNLDKKNNNRLVLYKKQIEKEK